MNITKREQAFLEKINLLPAKTVTLYLNSPEDLTEPTNFTSPERYTLNEKVKDYLNKAAEDITIKYSIKIELHFRDSKESKDIDCEKIIHDYYANELENLMTAHKKNHKHWQFRLLAGILFLAACHGLSLLFGTLNDSTLTNLLQDSFEIMGWVAIWEPSTYFLFSRREEGHTISDCFQLKNAKVEIVD